MNKRIVLIFITMTFLVLLCFSLFPNDGGIAQAQEKKFLADVHAGKGMNCASCHKESPPKEKVPTDVCVKCNGVSERQCNDDKPQTPSVIDDRVPAPS